MKITYDRDADALYIRLLDASDVKVTRLSEDVAFDLDPDGRIAGIEILDARALFERPESPSIELEYLPPRPV
jgi:uncharacterized protein YuzE